MIKTWRVSTNSKLYNIDNISVGETFYQSRGNANMKSHPCEGDIVHVSHDKSLRLVCLVKSGFTPGIRHSTDENNCGAIRKHADNNEYAVLEVVECIPKDKIELKGVQRTWSSCKGCKRICVVCDGA